MSTDDRNAARHLRKLAELGLEKARTVQKQMFKAEACDLASLAIEFERAARLVRQSIAAEAELEQRRRRADRLAQERVRPPRRLIPEPRNRTVH